MIAIAYLIPVIACLLLRFQFDPNVTLKTIVMVLCAGEVTVGLLHYLALRVRTRATEYLGGYITDIYYEAPWTELVETFETETDSRGNTRTVRRIRHVYHPAKYYFTTSLGNSEFTYRDFYYSVRDLWQLPEHDDWWGGANIQGGMRFGNHCTLDDLEDSGIDLHYIVPLTETHRYTNKIRHSNSIFKFEHIDRGRAAELGLYDYPPIVDGDARCILSRHHEIDSDISELFCKFNALYAPEVEMRLFILVFDAAQGIAVTELQRAYWQGGNKNEFTVCIGLREDGTVEWARAFSWADEQTLEVDTAQWLTDHPDMPWREFFDWLTIHIRSWKRKEFADFNYIRTAIPLSYFIVILLLSVAENYLALHFALH